MLEDQVALLLQKYLGNYVQGLNKEALKISVWKGDVELSNMQLRPEALNALKLPVKVKAGFLGSVKLKVPWSRLGQEPVVVYLDRIFLLAEPATQVEGSSEDAIQEAKKVRLKELETKLLESQQNVKSEMNTSWLGSLVSTIIGNLKLSITNIHIRYEDIESNPGHPFAAGLMLGRLAAVTVDDLGNETFATGGALEHIQKAVELNNLAVYFDSDIVPWRVEESWDTLAPSDWNKIFELRTKDNQVSFHLEEHIFSLEPVTGCGKYTKLRPNESKTTGQALQKASVNLDNVTLSLSRDGYRDILKLIDNFASFNQRLRYAHHRPRLSVKDDPRSWWIYAYKVINEEAKKASGKFSWEQVLHYARLRKKYISLYASLLQSDLSRLVVDDNEEIAKLDRNLDIELIIQWRMLAHKFVEQSVASDPNRDKQKSRQSWWSFGWSGSSKDDNEHKGFTDEDWERLNKFIGFKEGSNDYLSVSEDKDLLHFYLEIHMNRNATKLITEGRKCLAELSCEQLDCNIKNYSEAKIFDVKLGSYKLSSPFGLLAESANTPNSLAGVFAYKPFDAEVDWSFIAKASPCYVTYIKESIDQIVAFFEPTTTISQNLAMETAAAVQMTIDGVKRTAQEQVTRVLNEQSRFLLDLDIAAPKITIPTKFRPNDAHATQLLLDLGHLTLCTEDLWQSDASEERGLYLQFNLVLSDVSAFLVDGNYDWSQTSPELSANQVDSLLPVIDKCGILVKFQQIQSASPFYPSTRLAIRLPSLGFHFSPARYHRLMQVANVFQDENLDIDNHPWSQADFEGWLSVLTWKGVGNREAIWQRRYCCLVGPFLYILEHPMSKTYRQSVSLRGKQVHQLLAEHTGGAEHVLALYEAGQSNPKVVEDANALILLFDDDELQKSWQSRLQGAIYRASGSAPVTSLNQISSPREGVKQKSADSAMLLDAANTEKLFVTGVLDELKICFSCTDQDQLSWKSVLLSKESRLFEFRAVGGQVEFSIRGNNILIGTILKSLEIEDQYCCLTNQPCYLARSFIDSDTSIREHSSLGLSYLSNTNKGSIEKSPLTKTASEDNFFEALEDLDDLVEYPSQQQEGVSEAYVTKYTQLPKHLISPPTFTRIPGLLPGTELSNSRLNSVMNDNIDSFVKAQIIIYDQSSPQYNNLDNWVMVTLATLSFYCHRPTVLASINFANAINIAEESDDFYECIATSSNSRVSTPESASVAATNSAIVHEPAIGLLGKGKTRIIFHLTLSMATAKIFLMNESGASIATLSQSSLVADIKVFPSSFKINASLGNLKISDDSLPSDHSYFWACDMRNPGGSSFVELEFSSFSDGDEDYNGFDYSLQGQLSEVRIVYLNRFIQEVVGYFMGLVPNNVEGLVKMKDQVSNSEKWVSKTDLEGSPALKLDLSLNRPIILLPRQTESMDYLELDVLHITVQNTFQWLSGDKNQISAVHLETLFIKVKDINLTVGAELVPGKTIIQDVNGLSVVVRRTLRDLLHKYPSNEASIEIDVLKAALSAKEYEVISECAYSNFSEDPHIVPPLNKGGETSEHYVMTTPQLVASGTMDSMPLEEGTWTTIKVSVALNLVELSLHSGMSRDSPLASVKVSGAWLLYKSNTSEEGFLFATLKGFSVIDDREGTKEEFRLAIGKSGTTDFSSLSAIDYSHSPLIDSGKRIVQKKHDLPLIPSMLILDATFKKSSTSISLCIQRPKLLVALDFLLAVTEFFVPSIRNVLLNEEDNDPLHLTDAIILDAPIYYQPSPEFYISPLKPLFVDDERYSLFIYDGKGGKLYLQDRRGKNLSYPSSETIIHVGRGKTLQFKNVTIMSGEYLDSCIYLATDSSYLASENDLVFLEKTNEDPIPGLQAERTDSAIVSHPSKDVSTELIFELQAIGPELTFYNTSQDADESLFLLKKVMHADLDLFCKGVMKGDSLEVSGNLLGFKLESNGIRVLEPFDASLEYSNASGRTNIHFSVSDIYMNFSFSILKLALAVEEEILAFLRMTSKKVSVVCSQFDRVGTLQNYGRDQTYTFWRPRAPSGFAVLGDCLTPQNQPPSRGVIAVNTSFVRVKKPTSYKLIWASSEQGKDESQSGSGNSRGFDSCAVWFPVPPRGYVAVGCIVAAGHTEPPLSAGLCILASLVSPCSLKDCIAIRSSDLNALGVAFWRVENSFGTFLPANSADMTAVGNAYELRHIIFHQLDKSLDLTKDSTVPSNPRNNDDVPLLESARFLASGRLFEAIASFKLIWWNQGTNSQKKLSVWRPVVPAGMVFVGDIAVQGYEPPNSAAILHDRGDEAFLKAPEDFIHVGHIKKQKGAESISFWLPQAPPGFVAIGCVASKNFPKSDDFRLLRCIRSDMVTGDQFAEESIWDSSDVRVSEPFSLWSVGAELGTFHVRRGFRKPPRRFALKVAGPTISSSSDSTVIDGEVKSFSAAVLDDYGGLMIPLFNICLDKISINLHGRQVYMNSTVSFTLAARSYNDKYDAWEALVEPADGFLRYQYDLNAPGATTQLRMTTTGDLNLNISASNANMIIQAYSSWNNLSHLDGSFRKQEAFSSTYSSSSMIDIHHRRNYHIIPQNKLGQDIYIRATEFKRVASTIRLPPGESKPVKVPVSKNLLDSHLKGKSRRVSPMMVTVVIANAEVPVETENSDGEYMVAVRLFKDHSNGSSIQQQSARTCGARSENLPSGIGMVDWSEIFFFKVDSLDNYIMQFIVTDLGKGEPVGIYSAPLEQIACELSSGLNLYKSKFELTSKVLSSAKRTECQDNTYDVFRGKINCAILIPVRTEGTHNVKQNHIKTNKQGFIQISPNREGPWTTVRLNYASPAACWRFGNDVVASEVSFKDGDRYVNIRSLVSVTNNTDFVLDLRLKSKASEASAAVNDSEIQTIEFLEVEKYVPSDGWVSSSPYLPMVDKSKQSPSGFDSQGTSLNELPDSWEWVDDWHIDTRSTTLTDGWVTSNAEGSNGNVRQRKWIRHKRCKSFDKEREISVGNIEPGDTIPLPLSGLAHPVLSYIMQLRANLSLNSKQYSWSIALDRHCRSEISSGQENTPDICVSNLIESNVLLFCSEIYGTSDSRRGLWFCVSIEAKVIGKDMNSDPIHDWTLIINSPISLVNYLPVPAEYTVFSNQLKGENTSCVQGTLKSGDLVKIYDVDFRDPLYLSILPEGGWQLTHDPVPISHASKASSKLINLRSSYTGRIVQVMLENNPEKDRLVPMVIRFYVAYWISSARCPPLTYKFMVLPSERERRRFPVHSHSNARKEKILWQITEEEMVSGYTLSSAISFKGLGLSAALGTPGKECFGPVKDLAPLGDMDGAVELYAYDADDNSMRIVVSSRPSPYQSVPTKVISIRPYMTFTNRTGGDVFIKLNARDETKTLHAFDSRVSFVSCASQGPDKLQVRLQDTDWCFPLEIEKEDTVVIVLRKHHGGRRFLRAEVRGYEEGSRFVVVFRLGCADGPLRIENRTISTRIKVRQSGLDEDAWICLEPLSTTKFSWEVPDKERLLDTCFLDKNESFICNVNLENATENSEMKALGINLVIVELKNIKIVRFVDDERLLKLGLHDRNLVAILDYLDFSNVEAKKPTNNAPLEIIIELGVVGVSLIDHRPRELLYLYLERVFVSYSTGFDAGKTSRFKLILGQLQLDNQLPLTVMPVLLACEVRPERNHPVFKTTITISSETADGTQLFPYIYVRVTDKWWRLNIHEPVIWSLVDLYRNLRIDSLPESSSVAQVDPEIRIELIDVSEIRLKLSLETAPTQRPPGVFGMWSPVLSAVGNALKIQVHLRKVIHRSRYMRKSSILPAILDRIRRDLIHNPLHLIFSVDILGMTKSTLASLSKGFAELSTDGQFLQLRTKQVRSRRITGVGDGILQGTEAFAQGVAFGVSGVLRKPVESTRQHGPLGLAYGIGRAFLGFVVQPLSGALDFVSLTVDGISASFSRCLEILNNKKITQRIRNPRVIHSDGVVREYNENEAIGQMVLYLAEASTHLGCTDLFKEPSKFAWSDYYEDHFIVPYQRIVLMTNKRVMLLQCFAPDKMDKKPCKILWDVSWEDILALELAKAGYEKPSHVIIHLKNFRKSETFVRLIRCHVLDDEAQAISVCSAMRKLWIAHQTNKEVLLLKVPSSQRNVQFVWDETEDRQRHHVHVKPLMKARGGSSMYTGRKFMEHTLNFKNIWSSEQEVKNRCTLLPKQIADDGRICSIWRPLCPEGYVSVGDISHIGTHSPHVSAVYQYSEGNFALPVGYDLVWRNCTEDYAAPVSIWLPRPADGYVAIGCVAVGAYEEPQLDSAYCVKEQLAMETAFEEQMVWSAPDAYPWSCYIYQVQSEALQFVALRQRKEEMDWRPMKVSNQLAT